MNSDNQIHTLDTAPTGEFEDAFVIAYINFTNACIVQDSINFLPQTAKHLTLEGGVR